MKIEGKIVHIETIESIHLGSAEVAFKIGQTVIVEVVE